MGLICLSFLNISCRDTAAQKKEMASAKKTETTKKVVAPQTTVKKPVPVKKIKATFIELGSVNCVRAIPTQVFLDGDGKEYFRHEGYFPKAEIISVFKEAGVK